MSIEQRDSATSPTLPGDSVGANHSGNSENNASVSLEPKATARANDEVAIKRSHIVAISAAGLAVCFFLPWLHFLFSAPSGFEFTKMINGGLLLWAMPIFSVLTFFAVALNQPYQGAGQLAAITPFLVLAYGVYLLGTDIFRFIQTGGWIALGCGAVLFLAARK